MHTPSQYEIIKETIKSSLSAAERIEVYTLADQIKDIVTKNPGVGHLALALVGSQMAEEG